MRFSPYATSVPNRSRSKLPSWRYRVPVLAQSLSKVHHGDGVCDDQPKVGFGKGFAWTTPSTEPPHRVYMLEDFRLGRIHEAVWAKDFWVGVYIFVSCDTPNGKVVRLKVIGDGGAKGTKGEVNAYQALKNTVEFPGRKYPL